ncbi:MAG: zinc metallopeptidase [Bacilli bacterium]|nr:zinc metallopeptidase [Bacilli bacterium]
MYLGIDYTYIFVIIGAIIVAIAQAGVMGSYKKYREIDSNTRMRGKDVARKILDANGLENVKVKEVGGELTDHYNPSDKTVNLSSDIYSGDSIAAVAVAAHECGHAIQDKNGYFFLKFRHGLVPLANLCSQLGYIVILIGIGAGVFNISLIGIVLLGVILLFHLVTLPVEFNASNRAKKQLKSLNITNNGSDSGISKMLYAAGMTYVASLASNFLQIFRLILIALSRRRD